jgi:tRNA(adenine34) deaminase
MGRGLFWFSIGARRGVGTRRDAAPTPLDEAMMVRALHLAREAGAQGEVPVGAVVYRLEDGSIVGEGSNTREARRDPAGHAEFIAITRACAALGDWRCTGLGLAVTLEPCAMCAGLIVNARVDRVVYGCHDPKAGCVRTLARLADDPRLNHRAAIVPGVMAEPCAQELRTFFRKLRKRQS